MAGLRLVLAETRPVRRQRLAARLRMLPGLAEVTAPPSLMDCYTEVEAGLPDLVLVGADVAALPEYDMFAGLMRLLEIPARRLPEGEPAALAAAQAAIAETAARAGAPSAGPDPPAPRAPAVRPPTTGLAILIGASTGGIEALHLLLGRFPAECPPVLIVQHIRGSFSAAFARRLGRACRPAVAEASDGRPLERGLVLVAPGDSHHLELAGGPGGALHCRLASRPPVSGHRPSVDALFHSAVPWAPRMVGVLLTGMGADGAAGLLHLRRAGAVTLAQDQASCTVYGMPRVAAELGAAGLILPLGALAEAALAAAAAPAAAALSPGAAR